MAQEELHQQVQHLASCRLRFSFLAAIPSVEQECEKAHFTDRYEADIGCLSFMMGDFGTVIKEAREALSQKELPQKYKNFLRVSYSFDRADRY